MTLTDEQCGLLTAQPNARWGVFDGDRLSTTYQREADAQEEADLLTVACGTPFEVRLITYQPASPERTEAQRALEVRAVKISTLAAVR